jgi:hypothetical protein
LFHTHAARKSLSAACANILPAEEEPSSHRFFGEAYTNAGGAARRFQKAVLREWDMLRGGLPPGIWVRAYESRCCPVRLSSLPPCMQGVQAHAPLHSAA